MNTAIVYYSMSGNVKFVVEEVAAKIGADLIEIEPIKEFPNKGMKKFLWGGKSAVMGETPALKPYVFDADKYDAVIIGSPVWASTITPPIRTFVKENGEALKDKKIGLILCFAGGGADKATEKFKKLLDLDDLIGPLVLIDPKDSWDETKQKRIEDFCKLFA